MDAIQSPRSALRRGRTAACRVRGWSAGDGVALVGLLDVEFLLESSMAGSHLFEDCNQLISTRVIMWLGCVCVGLRF